MKEEKEKSKNLINKASKSVALVCTLIVFLLPLNILQAAIEDQFEISATVVESAATPEIPSRGGGGSGDFVAPLIYDIQVSSGQTNAEISWKTRVPAQSIKKWGSNNNLDLGQYSENSYSVSHNYTIENLESLERYFFRIEAVSEYGARSETEILEFYTTGFKEGIHNPTNFEATARIDDIRLTWNNPQNSEFKEVRLVRSEKFFPGDPDDGEVIYEGRAEEFIDRDVKKGVTYYYTLFARELNGAFSSGVVQSGRIPLPGETKLPEEDIYEKLPKAPSVHPLIQSLQFSDFEFIQDGRKIQNNFPVDSVLIDGNKALTIDLNYQRIPEVLKSIVVTMTHPTKKDKKFSFLLRVNKEKTYYTSSIAALGESGLYDVDIAIVDFKNQGLKKINGNLFASIEKAFAFNKVKLPANFADVNKFFWL